MHVFTYVGGTKGFTADNDSVTEWCLNRPEQAKNTTTLKQMAGVTDIYKVRLIFIKLFDHHKLSSQRIK